MRHTITAAVAATAIALLAGPALAGPEGRAGLPAAGAHAPGHAADLGNDMLLPLKSPMPAELPNRGKVLELIKTDSYAFIQVAPEKGDGKTPQWIAGPLAPMQVGDVIGYSDGAVARDFYSKTLGRNFSALMFADHVAVVRAAGK